MNVIKPYAQLYVETPEQLMQTHTSHPLLLEALAATTVEHLGRAVDAIVMSMPEEPR